MQKLLISVSVVFCFSVVFAAVLFLKFSTVDQVEAANVATCQKPFDRPLLFGVNIPLSAKASQRVKDVGGTGAHIGLNWDDFEPQKGQYNLPLMDGLIDDANAKGLVIIGKIGGAPDWAATDPGRENYRSFPKDSERETYKNFVKALVNRHKGKIKYWSYWNEPNGCGSSSQAGDCSFSGDAFDEYIKWLNITYDAIKEADPTAQVIGGELDYWRPVPDHVKRMVDKGAKFDILGIHPYDKDNNGIDFNGLKSAYEASGNKPVWLTEYGWGGTDTSDSQADAAKWIAQDLNKLATAEFSFVKAAFYHEIFDYNDGEQGLSDKNAVGTDFRINGAAFREASLRICNPATATGGPATPANPPANTSQDQITIRTYYTATGVANNGQNWPKIALYANNMAGIDTSTPNDTRPCDGSVTDISSKCGTLTTNYPEKLIANFDVGGSSFQSDHIVPINKVVEMVDSNLGITKLSYAFYNDFADANGSRDVWINKVEFYGHDGKMILSYTPEKSTKGYVVSPTPANDRALEKFYFDMGIINMDNYQDASQNRMVKAFDKQELKDKPADHDTWELKQEGSFNLVTTRLYAAIVQNYGSTTLAACSVATADNQGAPIKRGTPVTLSSVATVPIKTFKYTFYNPQHKVNNVNQPFCVTGAPRQPNDTCPAGSGHLVITVENTNSANKGDVQAIDWLKLPNNEVIQSVWKGDIGSNRRLPYNAEFGNAAVPWNFSNHVGALVFGTFTYPSTPEVETMATYSTDNKTVIMEMWRHNQQWYNAVPFLENGTNLDWGKAGGWTKFVDLNIDKTFYPGTGLITARSSFMAGGRLYHIHWRGDQEWIRSVPVVNGVINNSEHANDPNKGYRLARTLSDLPGTGKVQALAHIVMPNGSIQEQMWRGNQARKRTIAVTNGTFDYKSAAYGPDITTGGMTPDSDRSNSQLLQYNQVYQKDASNNNQYPEYLQVNATFVTADNKPIDDNGSCVARFNFEKSIPGDVDGNCVNDIYDYNLLIQYYGQDNCQYNLVGSCRIDDADLTEFKSKFGQKCPA